MAKDDDEILVVKSKPKLKSSPGRSSGGPYKAKRPSSAGRPAGSGRRASAKELWMESLKNGTGALSSGRKPGQHPGKRTPTEYWMDTLRKTGAGRSTESTKMSTLSGVARPNDKVMPFLSTSHYMRQMAGVEKTPRKSVDPVSRPPPGTPNYKSQEEYYEEILELRKQIASLGNDNSLMKSKVRRLEEDNGKKEREIEKLLDPSKSEEMRRSLADKRADTGTVIHGLKQKIVRLEQQLKEREAAHKKLQSDIKVTRMDEMKVQLEAFYTEIIRLQQGGSGQSSSKSKGKADSPVKESKETAAKVRALNETILRLNDTNTRLQEENQLLKKDLEKQVEESHVAMDTVDGKEKEYVDMSKRQLISAIAKLHKQIDKMDQDNLSIISDLERRRDGQVEGKIFLQGSLNDRIDQLDKRETELLQEKEALAEAVRKTKEDRNYFRKKCEDLEKEVKELKKELKNYRAGSDMLDGREKPGRKGRVGSAMSEAGSDRASRAADLERQKSIEEFKQRHAAKVMQRSWRKRQSDIQKDEDDDDAASLIGSALRGHHTRKERASQLRKYLDRPDSRGAYDTVDRPSSRTGKSYDTIDRPSSRTRSSYDTVDRPSSRGMKIPYDLDSMASDDFDDDVATIQSAFRGHMGRKEGARRRSSRSPTLGGASRSRSPPQSKKRSGKSRAAELDSEGESLEDESILARALTPPAASRAKRTSPSVFASPRRRSPIIREIDSDEDDDDIVF